VACLAPRYFSSVSHKQYDFRKKILNTKYVLIWSKFFSGTFLILRNERDMIKNVYWSPCEALFILVRLQWKLKKILSDFRKYSNIKFRENTSRGSRGVPCGRTDEQTDRYDEANSRFSQFYETGLITFWKAYGWTCWYKTQLRAEQRAVTRWRQVHSFTHSLH